MARSKESWGKQVKPLLKSVALILVIFLASCVLVIGVDARQAQLGKAQALKVQMTQNACDLAAVTTDYSDCNKQQIANNTEYLCKDVTKVPYRIVQSCWVELK